MDVLTIPRTAVDRSLRILRLPLDTTMGMLDRGGGKVSAVGLVVDRADAAVRRFAGRVLHDEELQRDAQAREIAVRERQRALELRAEAELRRRRADGEFEDRVETAEARRAAAEQRADEQLARVGQEREAKQQRVAAQTAERKAATRKAAERTERSIDEREKKARLTQLEQESEVLAVKEASLTTTSEAQRLQRAASEVKSKRKSG